MPGAVKRYSTAATVQQRQRVAELEVLAEKATTRTDYKLGYPRTEPFAAPVMGI